METNNEKRKYQKRKVGTRVYSTVEKYDIAKTYKDVLIMINLFGNGFMLQTQLQDLLNLSGRYKRKASVGDALFKLKDTGIVKEVKLPKYRSKFIIFKTFAWQFVKEKDYAREVSATKKIGMERYSASVFKAECFIALVKKMGIREWANESGEVKKAEWAKALNSLRNQECSIFFNQSRLEQYMKQYIARYASNESYVKQYQALDICHENDLLTLNSEVAIGLRIFLYW